jgi:hypothetical protein
MMLALVIVGAFVFGAVVACAVIWWWIVREFL